MRQCKVPNSGTFFFMVDLFIFVPNEFIMMCFNSNQLSHIKTPWPSCLVITRTKLSCSRSVWSWTLDHVIWYFIGISVKINLPDKTDSCKHFLLMTHVSSGLPIDQPTYAVINLLLFCLLFTIFSLEEGAVKVQ